MQDKRVGLAAQPRTVLGKRLRALRRAGWTPANLFGPGEASVAIQVPTREMERLLAHVPRTALISLGINGGEGVTVLVREVDRKPTTDELYHVSFHRVSMMQELRAEVPLVLVGEAAAAKRFDATILREMGTLPVECLPNDLPLEIEVNIEALAEVDDAIHVRDLVLPPRVKALVDPDEIVVHALAPKLMAAEAVERGEEPTAEASGKAEKDP